MKLKTAQIIMMLKQPQKFESEYSEFNTYREIINLYMSLYSGTQLEFYDTPRGRNVIDNVVMEVLYDYIDTCDKPSFFLKSISEIKDIMEYRGEEADMTEVICSALVNTQVLSRNENLYINGFTEENSKVLAPEDFE